ncbi:ribonuclease HII [Neorickettsia sp. 179522]|uniref:ribonuclease HII n=1 Tax=Neorickettsia sp. 179522 TaxID=1714371 RepID=UPI00079768C9|nr:ribonuclease HII [Neorickettsia sp. 179522]KYH12691.1 ribonuclease HII [Neorickettsia sp. 179522]
MVYRKSENTLIAGVDEVGRGCLAGPVVACAVILKENLAIPGDSKALSSAARLSWYDKIMSNSYSAVGMSTVKEIETMNILNATLLAMERALERLPVIPTTVLIDGRDIIHNAKKYKEVKSIISGDKIYEEIKAASIVAKVTRDRLMEELDPAYPYYGWRFNKGYGTKAHLEALAKYGVTDHHRRKFAPIRKLLLG